MTNRFNLQVFVVLTIGFMCSCVSTDARRTIEPVAVTEMTETTQIAEPTEFAEPTGTTSSPAYAPEVNGYYLKSRTDIYGDGRTSVRTYTLDLPNRRIYSDNNGDYHEFDEHGRITMFRYSTNGSKSREYLRDDDWKVIKKIGVVSGKPNIDTEYEYENANLVKSKSIYHRSVEEGTEVYIYDELDRLVTHLNSGCSFTYKELAETSVQEVGLECGDSVRRRHIDGSGNIIDDFYDDTVDRLSNTEEAKLHVFSVTYEYEKTESLVPNVPLFDWLLNRTF